MGGPRTTWQPAPTVTLLWGQRLLPASLHGAAVKNLQPGCECCEDWPAASELHGTAGWRLKPWCHAVGPGPLPAILHGMAVRADWLPVRVHGTAVQSLQPGSMEADQPPACLHGTAAGWTESRTATTAGRPLTEPCSLRASSWATRAATACPVASPNRGSATHSTNPSQTLSAAVAWPGQHSTQHKPEAHDLGS